jgi:hypothetical protein
MSVATGIAMAQIMNEPHSFIAGAMVGDLVDGGVDASPLAGLMVKGEQAIVATAGESGSALFTSHRLLVGQRAGIISKRLTVSSLRRDAVVAYSIDPDSFVTLELLGVFGTATLMFDIGFDPMLLSHWLGETLALPLSLQE